MSYRKVDEDMVREARNWLSEHVPTKAWPPIYDRIGVELHREWERKLFDARLSAVQWPVGFGGRDAGILTGAAIAEEFARAGAPERLNPGGIALFGPTLMTHGTDKQRERWLRGILRCDDLWCQGFSEPEAGSDLAALRTRGTVASDRIRVSGQKIWTSLAKYADWMFALVRTGAADSRHHGITYLAIDMTSPGVQVRPIRQVTGADSFAEVFLDGVEVPMENVIGEIDDGWNVAISTLGRERGSGLHTPAHLERDLQDLVALLHQLGLDSDARCVGVVGALSEEVAAYRAMTRRTLLDEAEGRRPARQSAMGKLYWSELAVRITEAAVDALSDDPRQSQYASWQYRLWHARGARLLAGTSEVQRNIIGERWLALPKEVRGGR